MSWDSPPRHREEPNYTRLDRGNARGVSDQVLESVSRALQLNEAEHAHLFDLARAANMDKAPRRTSPPAQKMRASVARLVDSLIGIPAFVANGRLDVVYANSLGEALYSEHFNDPIQPPNTARFLFLDPQARTFYVDWEQTAHDIAAALRHEAGRNPHDRAPQDLIGLLSTRSEEFRTEWARHDVRQHRTGTKRFRHPMVGDLTLAYEVLELPADPGLTLVTFSAEPDSPSEAALAELGLRMSIPEHLSTGDADS